MDERYRNIGEPPDQLMEECAEVIHVVCKAKRFGWLNCHPNDVTKKINALRILDELEDLKTRMAEFRRFIFQEILDEEDPLPNNRLHLTGQNDAPGE